MPDMSRSPFPRADAVCSTGGPSQARSRFAVLLTALMFGLMMMGGMPGVAPEPTGDTPDEQSGRTVPEPEA